MLTLCIILFILKKYNKNMLKQFDDYELYCEQVGNFKNNMKKLYTIKKVLNAILIVFFVIFLGIGIVIGLAIVGTFFIILMADKFLLFLTNYFLYLNCYFYLLIIVIIYNLIVTIILNYNIYKFLKSKLLKD